MEIRQLKYFLSIAESGSFSNASRKHNLSQSAISQQIKALEDELKTTLFVRTSHKVELTESGEILLPLARRVIDGVIECEDRMAEVNNLMRGELNIGLTHLLEPYVRKVMLRFMRVYPNVILNIYYKSMVEIMEMLHDGKLDIAFSIDNKANQSWADSIPVIKCQLCAILRDTHPLATRQMLKIRDLDGQPMIHPEKGLRNTYVENMLAESKIEQNVRAVVNDQAAILNLVRQSNCVTILSKQTCEGQPGVVAIPVEELYSPFVNYAHTRKVGQKKKSAMAFLQMLQETIS